MSTRCKELDVYQMELISGGRVNNNMPHPSDFGDALDEIINGESYEALAQLIVDYLNGYEERTRLINSNVDIYDCEI